jgi:hypothetical protein
LFAAFEVATGKVKAAHKKRRRRKEFLDFMDEIVAAYPKARLKVVLDNLNTHKKNDEWLKTPPARDIPLYTDARLMAQSGRGLVLHLAGPVVERRIVHVG